MPVSFLSCILCVLFWQVGACFGWSVHLFLCYISFSSPNPTTLKFAILKKEEVCILKTRKECSVQCALWHNGLATVISSLPHTAFCNSSLKHSFFSLYINPTNGHHYYRIVSARTKHTFEKETFVQWYSSVHSFLITEKLPNQYPLSQNNERLPAFSLIFSTPSLRIPKINASRQQQKQNHMSKPKKTNKEKSKLKGIIQFIHF